MSDMNTTFHGLTGLILEALMNATPQVIAEGEDWSPEMLEAVGIELREQLAPAESGVSRRIFDFVFDRSFGEASEVFHKLLTQAQYDSYPSASLATA